MYALARTVHDITYTLSCDVSVRAFCTKYIIYGFDQGHPLKKFHGGSKTDSQNVNRIKGYFMNLNKDVEK